MSVADVYRALWRHKLLIAIGTIVAVGATWYVTSTRPKVYTATALIRVQQRITDPTQALGALQTGGRLVQTYAAIATTGTIEDIIARDLKGQVPGADVYGSISAQQVQNLELMTISAHNANPQYAALIANAAPDALRTFIAQTATIRDQIITVQRAGVPSSPSSPRLKYNLTIALLLALILNGGLALVAEFLLDRVSGLDELEMVAGRPILATVPVLKFDLGGGRNRYLLETALRDTGAPDVKPARTVGRPPRA